MNFIYIHIFMLVLAFLNNLIYLTKMVSTCLSIFCDSSSICNSCWRLLIDWWASSISWSYFKYMTWFSLESSSLIWQSSSWRNFLASSFYLSWVFNSSSRKYITSCALLSSCSYASFKVNLSWVVAWIWFFITTISSWIRIFIPTSLHI